MKPYRARAQHRACQAKNGPIYIDNSRLYVSRPAIPARLSYLDL